VGVLAVLLANGAFAYRLARAWPAPRVAGLAAGWLAVSLPFVAANLGVLPVMPVFGIAWTLEGLVRFGRSGALRHAAWAGGGFLALFFSSQQLALLFAPFALAAGVLALTERGGEPRLVGRALGVATVVGVLIVAFSIPVLATHARLGLARPERLVQALSANPRDFVTRPATALFPFPPRAPAAAGDMGGLFPGFLVLALGAGGLVAGFRAGGRTRRFTLCLAGLVVASGVLALGLNVSLLGWRPFAALRVLIPGFDRLRSPFRFAALAQLGLVALSGLGLAGVARRVPRPARWAAVAALGILGAAENLSLPGSLLAVPPSPRTPWSAWLRDQPPATVIAHVPVAMGLHVADYAPEAWRMFRQMDHRLPMMNGYSSYFPPGYGRFQFDVNRYFPTRPLLCFLSQSDLGITTLVVDRAWRAERHPELSLPGRQPLLVLLYADTEVEIYRLAVRAEDCRTGSSTSGSAG
jgi:hypothetical protein